MLSQETRLKEDPKLALWEFSFAEDSTVVMVCLSENVLNPNDLFRKYGNLCISILHMRESGDLIVRHDVEAEAEAGSSNFYAILKGSTVVVKLPRQETLLFYDLKRNQQRRIPFCFGKGEVLAISRLLAFNESNLLCVY
jgi:hypothetical protein